MRKKIWLVAMSAVIVGVSSAAVPRTAHASTCSDTKRICLAEYEVCSARDQCCSHLCNIDGSSPGSDFPTGHCA